MPTAPRDAIYRELRQEFMDLQPGDPIPSIRSLMARFEVSQVVIDRVMSELRREFVIISEVGRGSYLASHDVSTGQGPAASTVEFYLPDLHAQFLQQLEEAIRQAVDERDLRIRVHRYQPDRPPQRLLDGAETLGLLLVPPSYLCAADLAVLESVAKPLVLLDAVWSGIQIPGIASDNSLGGALAADHLIGQGLERLAVVSCEPQLNRNVVARQRGFQNQCLLAGLADPPILTPPSGDGLLGADAAYSIMTKLLQQGPLAYDGVFADSAPTASGVLAACRDAGVRIPHDLALVAFDDTPEARYAEPSITVLRQELDKWAACALEMLSDAGKRVTDAGPAKIQVPPTLIVRESSRVELTATNQT